MSADANALLPVEQHLALTQALYREARLLDAERYADWLALLADDVRYRLPLTSRRFRADRSAALAVGAGYVFDDDKARLGLRVQRLESGLVWAEDPRNAVRRVVRELSDLELSDSGNVGSAISPLSADVGPDRPLRVRILEGISDILTAAS